MERIINRLEELKSEEGLTEQERKVVDRALQIVKDEQGLLISYKKDPFSKL